MEVPVRLESRMSSSILPFNSLDQTCSPFLIGLVATVSARTLNVASLISLSGLLHELGMRPQRICSSVRLPSRPTTASIVVVGQILLHGWRFDGGAWSVNR
jgi:hypothetical protein